MTRIAYKKLGFSETKKQVIQAWFEKQKTALLNIPQFLVLELSVKVEQYKKTYLLVTYNPSTGNIIEEPIVQNGKYHDLYCVIRHNRFPYGFNEHMRFWFSVNIEYDVPVREKIKENNGLLTQRLKDKIIK